MRLLRREVAYKVIDRFALSFLMIIPYRRVALKAIPYKVLCNRVKCRFSAHWRSGVTQITFAITGVMRAYDPL